MSLWRQVARGLGNLANRRRADREIAEEVEHYLDEAAAMFEARGLSPQEARRAARLEVGGAGVVREQVRGYGWENLADSIAADVGYAARRLRRSPAPAGLAVAALAIGIGASVAMFSAVNPVLVEPLPYPDADRLLMVWDGENGARADVTFGTYREVSERSRSFASLAVMRPLQATLTGVTPPERLNGQAVSAGYFRTLGVRPSLGRDFQAADDRPGRPTVVVVSDGLWRRRFAGDPEIVGRSIALDEMAALVIGVMPAGFENVLLPEAEFWLALQYDDALPASGREWGHHLRMVGRLRPDATPAQAERELATIARQPVEAFPRVPWASLPGGFIATPLQADLTRSVRPVLFALLGAVALLLVIACVNVTNLLLARGAERRTELAVRAALGASRGRLVRQLLAESLLLAGLGGLCGAAAAYAAVDVVRMVTPAEVPRVAAIAVDAAVLTFAVIVTLIVGVGIGVVPALQGARAGLHGAMQQRTQRLAGGHQLMRRSLVVAQVALAAVLLIGAGLILRSLQQLLAVPPGFDAAHVLTLQVQTSGLRFRDAGTTQRFFTDIVDAVRSLPGVSAAAYTSQLPLTGDQDVWGVQFESVPAASEESGDGYRHAVSPEYFATMGIPLRQGRLLAATDDARTPGVAVINESFARRRLPGLTPIGQRVRIGGDPTWLTVVGVVGDVKHASLASARADAIYVTAAQWTRFADSARWLVVRTPHDAAAILPAVRRAIWAVDREQPIVRVATMAERVRASGADRRFALVLFEAFALAALLLAAIGTYSLLAGHVTERTREIGVRSALGASRWDVVRLILRQGLTLAGIGVLIGLVIGGLASGAIATLLFGVSRLDAPTYAAVVGLLAAVSAAACAVPAWRATRIRPAIALTAD